ncbi:MAG: nickel-dependent lactate racemase [Halanaerobium sp.]
MKKNICLKYGKNSLGLDLKEDRIMGIIEANAEEHPPLKEIIKKALATPIGSGKLQDMVSAGDSAIIIISDITRSWQQISKFLPFIIEELQVGGVELADITVLSALGTHRPHTESEKAELLGESLYNKVKFIEHNAEIIEDMKYLGKTSAETPVWINKEVFASDHLILTGGIVFHNLAGFAGGRKSLLPGTAAYESIMKNHSLSLAENRGDGLKPNVDSNLLENNPVHLDMMEAAQLIDVDFIFNVIPDGRGGIAAAAAGDLEEAHLAGCRITEDLFGIDLKEKAELVIASAGGFPKDINLYQSSKALVNAAKAVKKGGYLILLADCSEGIGHPEVEDIIQNYNNNLEREDLLRKEFTISRYVGYLITTEIEDINCILVSNINAEKLSTTKIKVVKNLKDALQIAEERFNESPNIYIMPDAANTLPLN